MDDLIECLREAAKHTRTIEDVVVSLELHPEGIHIRAREKEATWNRIVNWNELLFSQQGPGNLLRVYIDDAVTRVRTFLNHG